jgi:hypothetical protein
LKQVDKDGKYNNSTVVALALKSSSADVAKMTVSPNPFVEKISVQYNAATNGNAEIRLLNVNGQTLRSSKANMSTGTNNLQVTGLSNLSRGVYIFQLLKDGVVIDSQKIIKN